MASYPSLEQMTQDIISGAKARGINPDYALRVTRAEGLQPNVWQSNLRYKSGAREKSYGPWQMNVDSPNALGSAFQKQTGLDPSDPNNWNAVNNYALDTVKKRGWGDWYGAKNVGITGKMGVDDNPLRLGPSTEEKPMNVMQPQFPALDPNNAIDPKKLTPLQLAMLQAQGEGRPMGPGSTPGLGNPNPMQLAMGQGDPSMFDPMAVPNNAPMNANQSVPGGGVTTPMQQAMQVGQSGPMDMAMDGPGGPSAEEKTPFYKDRDYWKQALIGAGAGLSSIDNPQGGAVALGLLKELNEDKGALSTYEALRLKQADDRLAFDQSKDANKPNRFLTKSMDSAVKRYEEMGLENESANMQLGQLAEMEKHLNSQGVYSGPAGDEVNWLKAVGSVLDPTNTALAQAASKAEAVKALQNQQALGLRSPNGIFGGLTGNTSDRDVKFLLAGVAGVDKLPGANKLIIDAMRKIYQRKIDYNKEASTWIEQNGDTKGMNGLLTHMDEWQKSKGAALEGHFPTPEEEPSSFKTPGGLTMTPL